MADPPTTTTDQQRLIDAAIAARAAKNADKDNPSTLSQPATSQWTTVGNPSKEMLEWYQTQRQAALDAGTYWPAAPTGSITFPNANYTPPKVTPEATTKIGSDDVGWYITVPITPDNPNGIKQILPPHAPNADEEIDKYLKREQNEALRTQRINNEKMGFGYADDDTVAKRSLEARAAGINDKEIALKYKTLDENKRQFDDKQKIEDAKAAQDILQSKATVKQIGANTQLIGANTGQVAQNVEFAAQDQPGKLAQAAATTAGTLASTEATKATTANQLQATQIAASPTVQTPPTGMSQWSRNPLTGEVKQGGMNAEWMPKTQTEVAARAGQIQSLANAKKAEVMAKVGENFSADQAYAEFNSWYDQQVSPQLGALKAAQQAAQIEQQKAQQAMRGAAMTTAQAGGQQALNAFQQLREAHPISDTTQDVMAQIRSGKSAKDVNTQGAFTWEGPSPVDLAQQGTQNALKYIDRSSAEANGLPPPDFSGIDIDSMLGRQQYMPGAGGPPPMPAMAGGGGPPQQMGASGAIGAPPAGGAGYDWEAVMRRQAADAALQRQQAVMQRQAADVDLQRQQAGIYAPSPYTYGG